MRKCPVEANNLKASAMIPLLAFVYNATIFSVVGNYLFGDAGHFNPRTIGFAIALALYILAVAAMYTMIETCKLNDVDPRAWLADVLGRIADHPASRLDELLPWNWRPSHAGLSAAA
jgi:hypothetical protein